MAGIPRWYGISDCRYPRGTQNASDFGTQARLFANYTQRLVSEKCTERGDAHCRPIAERPHPPKANPGAQAPVDTLLHAPENSVGASAVAAIELHAIGKTGG